MFGFLDSSWTKAGFIDNLMNTVGLGETEESPPEQFATWLPYRAYSPDTQVFRNADNCLGFMFEIMPQSGADQRMVDVLVSLYPNCPVGTGIQLNLFASPHIKDRLIEYAELRKEDADQYERSAAHGRPTRNSNLYRKLARQRVGHLMAATHKSIIDGYHFTVKDFRLVLSVTVAGNADSAARHAELTSLRDSMAATLNAASLPNRVCNAADLINWCSMFVNPGPIWQSDRPARTYDDGKEVRDQIVDFDTIQDSFPDHLLAHKPNGPEQLESRFFSIRSYPERFALWQMAGLIGDLMQPALQYRSPFMLTMGVKILDHVKSKTTVATNNFRATQNAESKMAKIMPDVDKKRKDWQAAADTADSGGTLVEMYHQLAIFTKPENATECVESALSLWRSRNFELNADVYMNRQALLASLPMTLSPKLHGDLKKVKRLTRKFEANAVHLAPLLAEWRGTRTPTIILVGRRGQLMTLDLYDNDLGNQNFAVIGTTGSGKSVMLNEVAWSYLSSGAKVWLCDLGRSFEKLCKKAGGTYIEFRPDVDICLNPFTRIVDINEDIDMLVPALAKMCSMQHGLDEVQYKAISTMILKLWKAHGNEMTITTMRDAFVSGTISELGIKNDQRVRDLAIMLNPYSKGGQYERFFEGRNNIDFANNLIVIENEELKRKPDLHAVVNILLLYQITGEMYLTRNSKKILIIDELKQQLGEIGSDDPVKARVVEEAARRARKYGGALGTATQSADDYYGSVQMEAAFNCSDWVFLLRQKPESIGLLDRKGRVIMDESKKRILNSLRTEAGAYADMYVSSPVGEGVGRLVLDPATHLLFSNKLEDNKPIDDLRASGHSIDDAIDIVLSQRGLR